ncbi:MAG: c-type cytochrome [Sulfurimonas sp.]|nr:c-type cytochrome [Sulfurimonas sp.]
MKKIVLTGLVVLGLFVSAHAEDGAALYKKCAGCHGPSGEKAALGASKIIKDMSHADFVAALNGYKDGSYGGAKKGIMKGQVSALNEAQIEALATHITK